MPSRAMAFRSIFGPTHLKPLWSSLPRAGVGGGQRLAVLLCDHPTLSPHISSQMGAPCNTGSCNGVPVCSDVRVPLHLQTKKLKFSSLGEPYTVLHTAPLRPPRPSQVASKSALGRSGGSGCWNTDRLPERLSPLSAAQTASWRHRCLWMGSAFLTPETRARSAGARKAKLTASLVPAPAPPVDTLWPAPAAGLIAQVRWPGWGGGVPGVEDSGPQLPLFRLCLRRERVPQRGGLPAPHRPVSLVSLSGECGSQRAKREKWGPLGASPAGSICPSTRRAATSSAWRAAVRRCPAPSRPCLLESAACSAQVGTARQPPLPTPAPKIQLRAF